MSNALRKKLEEWVHELRNAAVPVHHLATKRTLDAEHVERAAKRTLDVAHEIVAALEELRKEGQTMRLVWYQRKDGLWNAACACNASVCGVEFERRADAEAAHFDLTIMERTHRAKNPERFAGNQIPACGPKLPDPNPNNPDPLVFP